MKHLTLFFSLFPLLLTAQSEEFEYDSTLISVSFKYNSSDTSSRQIIVKNDTTFSPYLEPHYEVKSNGTIISEPVAYVSGSSAKVKAVFKMNCDKGPNLPAPYVYIKGVGVGDAATYDFGPITVAFDQSKKTYTFEDTCVKRFVKYQIGYFKDFNIEWKISLNNQTWFEAGTSRNTVYVLLGKPAPENSQGFDYLETIFYTSCKYGKGVKTGEILFNRMKAVFSSKQVKRVDGTPLYYYQDWDNLIITTNKLIKYADGQCIAWMKFFIDCHRIHGIKETLAVGKPLNPNQYIGWGVVVIPDKKVSGAQGIYCKKWDTVGVGSSMMKGYGRRNIWNMSKVTNIGSGIEPIYKDTSWYYSWLSEEFRYRGCDVGSNSICSQNNQNPKARFQNHQFVLMYGTLFDPSYGVSYGNFQDYSQSEVENLEYQIQQYAVAAYIKRGYLELSNQFVDFIRPVTNIKELTMSINHEY